MSLQIGLLVFVSFVYFLLRLFSRTDQPKIKGIPEVPGVPIFGNLLQLGSYHAKVAQRWAQKYGPVFQVRLGNKVSTVIIDKMRGASHVMASFSDLE